VLVSQNKQLVKQFCSTLAKNSLEVHNAGTKQELIKELYNGKTVLAISTNKLETLRKEKKPFDDKNLFILVDISHHTSKHTLYKNMNQLFASASYLGFSSTPFMQKEKTLLTQFSSILYKYTNAQALKDKIIVPLLYENRAKQLENNYVTRLQTLVSYIEKHFIQNFQGSNFQAILATNTEDQAYECHKLFTNLGSIKTALLLPNYEPSQEDETIELFIGTNLFTLPLHLPRATLLYLDQTLNSHALLETFSSINKLADGKDFGFIIDYRGLLGNLENPLTTYAPLHGFDEKDLLGTVIDIKKEIYQLPIHLHNLELFFGEDNAPKDEESYAIFLEEENKRILFYNYVFMCKKALKLSLASETTAEVFTKETLTLYKEKIQFYTKLKTYIQMRYCEHKEPLYLFSQTFEDTLATMKGINAKADTILYTLRATLAEKLVTNPHYYEKLLCKITDTLQAYNDYIISDQEKLDLAQEIKTTVLSQIEHPCAKAIFDNIAKEFHKTLQERSSLVIENIALSFAKIFQEMSKKPEWHTNQDILNQIDEQIENILWDLEDTYALKFQNMDELITKIRTIGIHNQTGNTTIPSIHHSNLN
jgi:type I restriction enzyme R subunit